MQLPTEVCVRGEIQQVETVARRSDGLWYSVQRASSQVEWPGLITWATHRIGFDATYRWVWPDTPYLSASIDPIVQRSRSEGEQQKMPAYNMTEDKARLQGQQLAAAMGRCVQLNPDATAGDVYAFARTWAASSGAYSGDGDALLAFIDGFMSAFTRGVAASARQLPPAPTTE